MRRCLFFCIAILLAENSAASSSEVRICSGQPKGGYHTLAENLRQIASQENEINIVNVITNGSVENIEKIKKNECDYAIIQLDAAYEKENLRLVNNIVDSIYKEPIHFLVGWKYAEKIAGNGIMRALEEGVIHGWRANSGHLQSALYLCSLKDGQQRCNQNLQYEEKNSTVSDEEIMNVVLNKLTNTGEIDAIVFTAFKGHEIVRKLLSPNTGVYIIDAENFPYNEYPYYEKYVIEQGTYKEKNKIKNESKYNSSNDDKNAYTFATLAILISSEEESCAESFMRLRGYMNEIRKNPSKNRDWYSLLNNPGYGVNAKVCVE